MREAIFVLNNPCSPRIDADLAQEIGFHESVVLLQMEYWIRTSTTYNYEGRQWTYQSVRNIQRTFKFWTTKTINRIVNKLVDEGYLIVGNFNTREYDKTRWFSLNYNKLQELRSIKIVSEDEDVMEKGNTLWSKSTTIPENTTCIINTNTHVCMDKSTQDFESFWSVYPRKVEKKNAYNKWKIAIKKVSPELLIKAAKNYADSVKRNGTEHRYIKHPATFLGPSEPYLEWTEYESKPKQEPCSNVRSYEETMRMLEDDDDD